MTVLNDGLDVKSASNAPAWDVHLCSNLEPWKDLRPLCHMSPRKQCATATIVRTTYILILLYLSFARHMYTCSPVYTNLAVELEFPQMAMTTSYYKSRCEGPAAQTRCPMMLYLR